MKITNVETYYLKIPDLDATKCDGTQDTLMVKISTDEGITGIGEIDSLPLVVKAAIHAPPSHSIATGLKNLLIGENPLELERLWHKMYQGSIYYGRTGPALHAISGIDIALWDIFGKTVKKSVSELLGGTFSRKIKAYASTLMPDTPKEAAEMAERYAKIGYKAVKFGWGPIGNDPKLDEELVKSIRSAIGDDMDLMIDAGMAWDLKTAMKMTQIYEKYDVDWLEEPLHPDNMKGYKELVGKTTMLIAGGEQESGRNSFRRWMDEANLDIIQPDLGRCGGLTEAKKIAYMAYDRHKRIVPHAFKTGILTSASAHFAASIPNGSLIEYTVSNSPLARDLVETSITFKDGFIYLPEHCSGLGIQINEKIFQRYLQ